jgi:hypothetical protein
MTQEGLRALIEDLRLNHEYCPKEIILQAADELEKALAQQSGWRKKQIDDAEEEAWKEMEKKAICSPFIVSELWRLSK